MPLDRESILIENIRRSLDLYQRSIIWAMTASAALFLLSSHQFDSVQPTVKILYSELSLLPAYLVALVLFLLMGSLALSAIRRAELNLDELNPSPEIRKAIFLYPSLATSDNSLFRVGTVLFCPLAVIATLGLKIVDQWEKLMAVQDILARAIIGWVFLFIVIVAIYGLIAKRVWRPFGR